MKRLAQQYPRYGYRRIRIFLKREGHAMSWERAHRLWKAASLQLPQRRPRRRIAGSRPRPLPPTGPNSVWAYDFVFDASAQGQQIECLTVIDEFTRECLAIDVAGSIGSRRVIDVMARLVSERGAPRYIRSDSGPEFVSNGEAPAYGQVSLRVRRVVDADEATEGSETAGIAGCLSRLRHTLRTAPSRSESAP
jgi:putative transposase